MIMGSPLFQHFTRATFVLVFVLTISMAGLVLRYTSIFYYSYNKELLKEYW